MAQDHPSAPPSQSGFSLDDVTRPWNTFVDRLDRVQRRHRPLSFVWAVWKRYTEDSGNSFAALVSYFAFFSIFPLLLVFVTVLGIVLKGNDQLRDDIVDSAFAQIPVIGKQLKDNAESLNGHGLVLALGLLTALYAGLRVIDALQHAMNTMWNVPQYERPNVLKRKLRDLAVVGVLGLGLIGAIVASSFGAFFPLPVAGRIFSLIGTAVVNVAVLILMFRLLTRCSLEIRRIWVGAVLGGLSLLGLQVLSGVFVRDVVNRASDTYGTFAVVIGLLAWVSLQARIVIMASETNVVLDDRLWPRGMSDRDPTEADLRAHRLSMEREARRAQRTATTGATARPLDTV
jgi:YihY family inner membrane protein